MVAGNKMQRITKRDGVDYAAKLKLLRGSAVEEGRPTKNNVTTAKGNEFVLGIGESSLQYKNYISALCAVTAAGAAFWWYKRKKRGNFPTKFMQPPPGAPVPIAQDTQEDLTNVTELRDEMARASEPPPTPPPKRNVYWIHIAICLALLGASGAIYFKYGRK